MIESKKEIELVEKNETLRNGESTLAKRELDENDYISLNSKLQQKKNKLRKLLKDKGILQKGAVNEFDNYEYFSEAQYKELFTELFSETGIELTINEIKYEMFSGTDKQPFGRLVTLACTLIDIDTGFSETTIHTGEGLDRSDKAGYKATTGALKRFLSSTFLVATKDDPEREDDDKKVKKESPIKKEVKNPITPGQSRIIKNLYKNDVNVLMQDLKKYKKSKLEQLTMNEASEIINKRKEYNNARFNNYSK